MNKINKPLSRLRKKDNTQTNEIKHEKGDIITEITKIKRIKRNYCENYEIMCQQTV